MGADGPDFTDYLSRHYAHLGDHAKHREGKKRQLAHTYRPLLPEGHDAEMLEIGPGLGQLLELLRRDLGYGRTTAVDVSQEVVDFCNAALPGSTERVADTASWLERQPARFERIFLLHVLEHVPPAAARRLLAAIRGALRPGGRVVIEVPNMANVFTGAFLRWADLTHETGFTDTSLRQLLASAGFTDFECFEERIPAASAKGAAAVLFRAAMRAVQRVIYRGYELPVPRVLGPALGASAMRPREGS